MRVANRSSRALRRADGSARDPLPRLERHDAAASTLARNAPSASRSAPRRPASPRARRSPAAPARRCRGAERGAVAQKRASRQFGAQCVSESMVMEHLPSERSRRAFPPCRADASQVRQWPRAFPRRPPRSRSNRRRRRRRRNPESVFRRSNIAAAAGSASVNSRAAVASSTARWSRPRGRGGDRQIMSGEDRLHLGGRTAEQAPAAMTDS